MKKIFALVLVLMALAVSLSTKVMAQEDCDCTDDQTGDCIPCPDSEE